MRLISVGVRMVFVRVRVRVNVRAELGELDGRIFLCQMLLV